MPKAAWKAMRCALPPQSRGSRGGHAVEWALSHTFAPQDQSYIITTYRYPTNPEFRFEEFYSRLSESGFVIYPGKLSQEPCFRIGDSSEESE